jgi:hypothetical protein
VTVSVAPQAVVVPTSGTAQFVAKVENSTGSSVQWEVNHVAGGSAAMGTINSSGLYRAPASVPGTSVEVTAVLQADAQRFGSAGVTVVAPVSLSPRQAALTTAQTMQFQANGPAVAGAGITWSASGGTITASGLYTPPGTSGVYTVTVASTTDPTAGASATLYVTDFAGQSSWRNDSGLTGQNRQELALNPATLAAGSMGKVASCAVDGQVHAQPLYAANLSDGNRVRNVVYVATEHDSVYAFDADAVPCQQSWKRSFLDESSGVTSVPGSDIPGGDPSSEAGIAGTPVIDRASRTLYLIARTMEGASPGASYVQRLHALDIVTGAEKSGSPVVITASAPGNGDGANGSGAVVFDPLIESQHSALLLLGGKLYATFGGHGEIASFHGWLLVYDAATLLQTGAFNSTPNGSHGGFAESGPGVSADASGSIFAASGQGLFDSIVSAPFRKDFGQTVFKLQPNPLTITDTFTPANQFVLSASQVDVGSTGVLILPDQIGAANPRLAIVGGSNGALYLLNRDNMGGYVAPPSADRVVQTLNLANGIYGTPAYWQNTVYVAAAGDALKAYPVNAGTLAATPSSQSSSSVGAPGSSPTVSSNGGSGGIVWVVDTSGADAGAPAVLRAFDATSLAREFYNSSRKSEDAAGPAARLAVPTVANGKVYVGTQNELTVYGLVP